MKVFSQPDRFSAVSYTHLFPFVVEGMVLGLLSGAISYGILYFVYPQLARLFTFGDHYLSLIHI